MKSNINNNIKELEKEINKSNKNDSSFSKNDFNNLLKKRYSASFNYFLENIRLAKFTNNEISLIINNTLDDLKNDKGYGRHNAQILPRNVLELFNTIIYSSTTLNVNNQKQIINFFLEYNLKNGLKTIFNKNKYINIGLIKYFYNEKQINLIEYYNGAISIKKEGNVYFNEKHYDLEKDNNIILFNENIFNKDKEFLKKSMKDYIINNNSINNIDMDKYKSIIINYLNLISNDENFINEFNKIINSYIYKNIVSEINIPLNETNKIFIQNKKENILTTFILKEEFIDKNLILNSTIFNSLYKNQTILSNGKYFNKLLINVDDYNDENIKNYIINNINNIFGKYSKDNELLLLKINLIYKDEKFVKKIIDNLEPQYLFLYEKLLITNYGKEKTNKFLLEIGKNILNENGNLNSIFKIFEKLNISIKEFSKMDELNNILFEKQNFNNINDIIRYISKETHYLDPSNLDYLNSKNINKVKSLIKNKDDLEELLSIFDISILLNKNILDYGTIKNLIINDKKLDLLNEFLNSNVTLDIKNKLFDELIDQGYYKNWIDFLSDLSINDVKYLPLEFLSKHPENFINKIYDNKISLKDFIITIQKLKESGKNLSILDSLENDKLIASLMSGYKGIINDNEYKNVSKFLENFIFGKQGKFNLELIIKISKNKKLFKYILENVILIKIGSGNVTNSFGTINNQNNLSLIVFLYYNIKNIVSQEDEIKFKDYIGNIYFNYDSVNFLKNLRKFNLKIDVGFFERYLKDYISDSFLGLDIINIINDKKNLIKYMHSIVNNKQYDSKIFSFIVNDFKLYKKDFINSQFFHSIKNGGLDIDYFLKYIIGNIIDGKKYDKDFINLITHVFETYLFKKMEKHGIVDNVIVGDTYYNKLQKFFIINTGKENANLLLLKENINTVEIKQFLLLHIDDIQTFNNALTIYLRQESGKRLGLINDKILNLIKLNIHNLTFSTISSIIDYNEEFCNEQIIDELAKYSSFTIGLMFLKKYFGHFHENKDIELLKYIKNKNLLDIFDQFKEYDKISLEIFLNLNNNFEKYYYNNQQTDLHNSTINKILGDVTFIGLDLFKEKLYPYIIKNINHKNIKGNLQNKNKILNNLFRLIKKD